MVAIKVTYGASVHKFNVAVDSTWATFEHNLRTLFKIPDNYKVIASYTDEDNDVITLSSDIELCEVLDHHSNDNNTPVRLVLNAIPTANNSNNKEIQETFEKMTIADDEKCCDIETETETENEICEKSSDEKCCNNKSSDEKCCEDEEEQSSSDPEVYYFVRSKRGPRFGSAKFDSFENSSGRCPLRRAEFLPPPHHRQPHHRQPHGGSFGPFGPFGPFNHHGGPPHNRGPSPRGFHGHLPSHPPPEYAPPEYELHRKHHGEFEEFGPHGGEFIGPFGHGPFGHDSFGHGRFHGGHGRFHGHGPRCNREKECCKEGKENHKDDKECNKGEKCEKDTIDPCVERDPPVHRPPGSHRPLIHPGSHRPHHSLPAFPDSYPHGCTHMRGHHHGHHPGFRGRGHGHGFRHHHHHRPRHNNGGPHCHRHHKPLTPEELAEKVALLNSMNFPSDKNAHYEELLKKFHGRIGRVVEILLCERKHKDDEDHKEPGDDDSDDDSNNDDPNNEFEEIKESETSPFLV
jgi:hypothetical protein